MMGKTQTHLRWLAGMYLTFFATVFTAAQPPEPLFKNMGAIWDGTGKMIVFTISPDETYYEAYALDLNSTKPYFLERFKLNRPDTEQPDRRVSLEYDSIHNAVIHNQSRFFDFNSATYYLPRPYQIGSNRLVGFSANPTTFTYFNSSSQNDTYTLRRVSYLDDSETVLFSIPQGELVDYESGSAEREIEIDDDLILFQTGMMINEFSTRRTLLTLDVSNSTSPTLTELKETINEAVLPLDVQGIENNILRHTKNLISMVWFDYEISREVREFFVGTSWRSHSVNPMTDDYYFHTFERVVEDPPSSGIFFTEYPVIISQDNFTTKTEVAFRIVHPTELPTPQDYVNHLAQVEEPLAGSPFPERKHVTPVLFKDPDRNNDGQIDVADLVMRINEINNLTTESLR